MIGVLGWLGDPVNPFWGSNFAPSEAVALCMTVTPTPSRTLGIAPTPARVMTVTPVPTRTLTITFEVCDE